MIILGIDTSGKTASVAVLKDGRILGEFTYLTRLTHSQIILPLVTELLKRLDIGLGQIDCIAVADGPGSYTGLRIGVAAVKGMTFNKNTKCFGVSTLKSLANNVNAAECTVFSVMNARQGIAYFGCYKTGRGTVTEIFPDKVCSFTEISECAKSISGRIILVGDICEKIKEELFSGEDRIEIAPDSLKLQRAASLCEIAQSCPEKWTGGDELQARYLQAVKAEKDKHFA